MRDAVGGAMTIQIIIFFLVVINGYLAFTINYTKAFRVKNEIISIIERNEGFPEGQVGCSSGSVAATSTACQIEEFLREVSYNAEDYTDSGACTRNGEYLWDPMPGGYCLLRQKVDQSGNSDPNATYMGSYYKVTTFVKIDIPIINNLFRSLSNLFAVTGETKLIYSSGTTQAQ